jgi:hypothetical protein
MRPVKSVLQKDGMEDERSKRMRVNGKELSR